MPQVPLLRQGNVIIASVQECLTDGDMLELQGRILTTLTTLGATGVIIDVSVLDVLDSFATRTLCDLANTVQLRGARTVIVGIQPEVALSMVLLGLSLKTIPTVLNLDAGLELIRRKDQPANA
jgi:rsbT antagonist protein RsbS